jgi:hypothetical protein
MEEISVWRRSTQPDLTSVRASSAGLLLMARTVSRVARCITRYRSRGASW